MEYCSCSASLMLFGLQLTLTVYQLGLGRSQRSHLFGITRRYKKPKYHSGESMDFLLSHHVELWGSSDFITRWGLI